MISGMQNQSHPWPGRMLEFGSIPLMYISTGSFKSFWLFCFGKVSHVSQFGFENLSYSRE